MVLDFKKDDVFGLKITNVFEKGFKIKGPGKVSAEDLGFIFKDELGTHWNINNEYSGIIQLEELEQIYNKMKDIQNEGD